MPNDAKLGLVFGVGLVVLIALVFFRRDAVVDVPPIAQVNASAAPLP